MARNLLLSLHLIAVISWMAGILYLYRLIVYHVEETEEIVKTHFRIMERKLYRFITRPAMVVAALAGVSMILLDPRYYLSKGWLWSKLVLVCALIGATLFAGRTVARLEQPDANVGSGKRFRALNELPTLLMIAIVLLVILKPF